MALADFQRAFAELVADPELCRAVAHGDANLVVRYALTPREAWRLRVMVTQPGMRTNCELYRSNRFGPIFTVLHRTCTLLGDQLRDLLDAYWRSVPPLPDLPFAEEARRFVDFVTQTASDRIHDFDRVQDVMQLELAINDAYTTGGIAKLCAPESSITAPCALRVEVTHEPTILLSFLTGEEPTWREVRRGRFVLWITQDGISESAI
jgi:hypothetical protein